MNINGMNTNGVSPYSLDRRQSIQHDLRHALFTLRTGIALLGQVREDPDKFAEVQALLDHEVGTASKLVDELLGRPDLTAPPLELTANRGAGPYRGETSVS